jgi:hypothetical protein
MTDMKPTVLVAGVPGELSHADRELEIRMTSLCGGPAIAQAQPPSKLI